MAFLCCRTGLDRKDRGKKQATWRVFSLKELHSATNNFNCDNKLGEGGFSSVYWGQLWDGSQIAVKRLKVWGDKADLEFAVEVKILARVRHKNLLSLRGYCAEGQEHLIVYEYMQNSSLMSHLHGQHSAECQLDWKRRMGIAVGSAEGIAYLHHHATPHIIHRDVRASNVLLDSNFVAQVANFGFAKLIPDVATHVTSRVKGMQGYLVHEDAMLGKASEEMFGIASESCDVFSFGVLLLEIASGKKPIERVGPTERRAVADWALPLARERRFDEMADPKLGGKYVEDELKRIVFVALLCAQSWPEKRPTMLDVLELLKGDSKEKLAKLEDDELFKNPPPPPVEEQNTENDTDDDASRVEEEDKDSISEEKENDGIEIAQQKQELA